MLTDPDECRFFPPRGAGRGGGVDRVTDRKVDSDGSRLTVFNVTVFLTGKEPFCETNSGYLRYLYSVLLKSEL